MYLNSQDNMLMVIWLLNLKIDWLKLHTIRVILFNCRGLNERKLVCINGPNVVMLSIKKGHFKYWMANKWQ